MRNDAVLENLSLPYIGAIDLGGTKIEARLFDSRLAPIAVKRIATPRTSFADLVDAIVQQLHWLERFEQMGQMAIGVGVPGYVCPQTRSLIAANLPTHGQDLIASVEMRMGRRYLWDNDCKSFALSESIEGAVCPSASTIVGLIMGTGVAAGLVVNQKLMSGLNGIAIEAGHIGAPKYILDKHSLPIFPCGCGRSGCYEAYIAGPGMLRMAAHMGHSYADVPALIEATKSGDEAAQKVYAVWLDIVSELFDSLQLLYDPNCIVLGGGLSLIENIDTDILQAFEKKKLPGLGLPKIRIARHGDSSGARGMAILAAREAGIDFTPQPFEPLKV